MLTLSPLNLRGLLDSQHLIGEPVTDIPRKKRDGAGEAEACWRCCACESVYTYRHQAEECCEDEDDKLPAGLHDQDPPVHCPVCAAPANDTRDAADCCLWKDLDALTRWRMADAVDAGSTWLEQLGAARA